MIGNDLFKIESDVSLSGNTYKSLIIFYNPLVGPEALYLYQYLTINNDRPNFTELKSLLNSLSMSIDKFEKLVKKLNEYKLITTLKEESTDKYVFILNEPLTINEFLNDNIFVRDFVQKTSGEYYRSVLSKIKFKNKYKNFEDVSHKLSKNILDNWTYKDEQYIKMPSSNQYNFGNLFDINTFLKGVSTTLFPLSCRTQENLKLISNLADLYDISYKKMAAYLSEAIKYKDQVLDVALLKYKCQSSINDNIDKETTGYKVPVSTFLMNKQGLKALTPSDKKPLSTLKEEYNLNTEVINYLIEFALTNSNNRLIGNYVFPIASDLHRNNIQTANDAKEFLDKPSNKKKNTKGPVAKLPDYSQIESNIKVTQDEINEALKRRKGKK